MPAGQARPDRHWALRPHRAELDRRPGQRRETDQPARPSTVPCRSGAVSMRNKARLPAGRVRMVDYFLKIDDIPGESQDPRHPGEIKLESFCWGESHLAHAGAASAASPAIED